MTPLEIAAIGFLACLIIKFVVGALNDNINVDAVWELSINCIVGAVAMLSMDLNAAEAAVGAALGMFAMTIWGLLQFLRTLVLTKIVGRR